MEILRRLRTERGLSQAKLAARAELDPSTVNQIERGAREASPATLRKLADALDVGIADLLEETSPKAPGRSSPEPSLFNGLEDERRLRYLRGWRAFVWKLERRWQQEPPKTSREIAPLFEVMTALMDEGVFEFSEATSIAEHTELMLFMEGVKGLNKIADDVQAGEEAEERRAALRVIESQIGA
jgi:transcriptional regulator with XRE-family HTH domain